MTYVKYTREMLSEAVTASITMTGVLRHLGLPQNGGAHAHLRRRISQLGIDTSHFQSGTRTQGIPSYHRRRHTEVLITRPMDAKREKPAVLRRALEELGRAYECAACGIGAMWNGQRLTLHVDHIDGQFWDCRPENVRYLCPNCHSQTATYAGRNRQHSPAMVRVDFDGDESAGPLDEQQQIEILKLLDRREVTVSDAARLIGCSRPNVYELKRRLRERGTLALANRREPISPSERAAVIAFALSHPLTGGRNMASALNRRPEPITLSPSSVRVILKAAGLGTAEARIAAAEKPDLQTTG